jgi:hypothetical protein
MPAKNSVEKSKATPAVSKAASAAVTAAPTSAKAPSMTVTVRKPANDKRAMVTRKEPRTSATAPVLPISERTRLIAEVAYFLAEKRGFDPAGATTDWLQAEAQVDGDYRFT